MTKQKKTEGFRKFFGVPLSKGITKTDDGKLFVTGKFTSDEKDELGDTITRGATERAVPAYKQWGNIRYMHQPRPVGKVVRIGDGDGLDWNEVEIKVVEPEAAFQVEEGLLSALSVGILVRWDDIEWDEGDGGLIIHDYTLAEISLVDHPANYDAKLDLGMPEGFREKVAEVGLLEARKAFGLFEEEAEVAEELEEAPEVEEVVEEEKVNTEPEAIEKSPSCRQEGESVDDCVARKIPEILDENPDMDNEQATAIAYSICEEKCNDSSDEEEVLEEELAEETPEEEVIEESAVAEAEETLALDETSEELDTEEEEAIEETTEAEEEIPELTDFSSAIEAAFEKMVHDLVEPLLERYAVTDTEELEDSTEGVEELTDESSEEEPVETTEELQARVAKLEEELEETRRLIEELSKPANRRAAVRNLDIDETEEDSEEEEPTVEAEEEEVIAKGGLRAGLRQHFRSRQMYNNEE